MEKFNEKVMKKWTIPAVVKIFCTFIIVSTWTFHSPQNQDKFLRLHDAKTKRLWFLWKDKDLSTPTPSSVAGKCGCLGGCVFFGMNKNGLTFFKVKRHKDGAQVVAVPQVKK